MPTFTVDIYEFDPLGVFSQAIGGTTTYAGPAVAAGSAIVTDNQAGTDGLVLDHAASETATADTVIGGSASTGNEVYAEEAWTLTDTVTGETFQIITFRINDGPNTGYYTLSERPLIPGRDYTTNAYDTDPDASAGDPAFAYAEYVPSNPDGTVSGTDGDDLIDASYTGDPQGEVVDGNDSQISPPDPQQFNWTDYADETDLRGGVTQNTGTIDVSVTYSDVQTNEEFSAETSGGGDAIYVGPGEPFSATSAGYVFNNGSADDTTIEFDFAANDPGFVDEVENVLFRISDIDGLNDGTNFFQDIVTINAFDADGNPVTVNITGGSNHTVTGNTITAALNNDGPGDASSSALIEIPGPVSRIEVVYDNGGTTQQAIYFSDVHFDAIPLGVDDDVIDAGDGDDTVFAGDGADSVLGGAGSDTIHGGAGSDTLAGGTGDDSIFVGDGDIATGGDGDDTFTIDPTLLNGGTISVTGGEGDETGGDTLDFNGQLVGGSIVYSNSDDAAGGLSGTATLLDGTVVTFSEIETIICFAAGTMIKTPYGDRPVEDLVVGDLVLTRDSGPQPIRWHGCRQIETSPDTKPIQISAGVLGNATDLMVSPQHRILCDDYRSQLYFGQDEVLVAARHLIDGKQIRQVDVSHVTYHHLMFDVHQIITSNGVETESYQPGSHSLSGLDSAAREELFTIFPELRANPISYGQSARVSVRGWQAKLLAS